MSATLGRRFLRLALYTLAPAIGLTAPFLVIPAITSQFGASGWSAVAIALSVGSAASVIGELGWGVIGPQRVAREQDPRIAKAILEDSIATKSFALAVLAPIAACVVAAITDTHRIAAALLAISVTLTALGSSWYFIGRAKPLTVVLVDTLPRICGSLIASIAIWRLDAPLVSYGALMIAATLVAYMLSMRSAQARLIPSAASIRRAPHAIRPQLVVILGRSISATFTMLPASLLGVAGSSSVAAFAAVDRPMRAGLGILTAVPNRLQSWIGVGESALSRLRGKQSVLINLLLGLAAGTVFAIAMPVAGSLLFGTAVDVSTSMSLAGGLLILLVCTSRGLGLALVSEHRQNSITWAMAFAAPIGIVAVMTGDRALGPVGAIGGVCVAEFVGVAVQAAVLGKVWRDSAETAPTRRGGTTQDARSHNYVENRQQLAEDLR